MTQDFSSIVQLSIFSKSVFSKMFIRAQTSLSSLLRIDDVGDVLVEAPGKVSQSILLFCQGWDQQNKIDVTFLKRYAWLLENCFDNMLWHIGIVL